MSTTCILALSGYISGVCSGWIAAGAVFQYRSDGDNYDEARLMYHALLSLVWPLVPVFIVCSSIGVFLGAVADAMAERRKAKDGEQESEAYA